MSRALSPVALEVLRNAAVFGWHVTDDNILDVADLVRAGLVRVERDYDSLKVMVTEAGMKSAWRRRLIEWETSEWAGRRLTFAPDPVKEGDA